MKIYFKDLPCYQELSEEEMSHRLYAPHHAFNLDRLPNESLRCDLAAFVFDRAATLSYLSLTNEATRFHNLADFLSEYYPNLLHLTDADLDDMTKLLKRYLLKTGRRLVYTGRNQKRTKRDQNPVLLYLKTAYEYFLPDDDSFDMNHDIWKAQTFPFALRASPIHGVLQINFTHIKQEGIKKQVKEASYYRLKHLSPATVTASLSAMNCLSSFLYLNYPDITTLKDFDRMILEEYLAYIYLECDRRKDYRTELCSLKSLLSDIGRVCSLQHLKGIFLKSDFPEQKRAIYKSYSDSEIRRLHEGYSILDKQTARLLLIHELLGLRISDTLTLKKTDVVFGKEPHIRITQPKTNRSYEKKINQEIGDLIRASIAYDDEKYGGCEYIFVSDKDQTKPMPYKTLYYRMKTMICTLDLKDDSGRLFTVGTHIMRHTYAKRLCDLFKDDATIAALLGHSSISSVDYYRKMSPEVLAEVAQPVIDKRNEKIKKYKKGWME